MKTLYIVLAFILVISFITGIIMTILELKVKNRKQLNEALLAQKQIIEQNNIKEMINLQLVEKQQLINQQKLVERQQIIEEQRLIEKNQLREKEKLEQIKMPIIEVTVEDLPKKSLKNSSIDEQKTEVLDVKEDIEILKTVSEDQIEILNTNDVYPKIISSPELKNKNDDEYIEMI